jgi:Flp pilus assembly pilin Flp
MPMTIPNLVLRFRADTCGATRVEFGLMASILGMLLIVVTTTMTTRAPDEFVGHAAAEG